MASPSRPFACLARCAITRTPYSALVENIIGLNPTGRVGEARPQAAGSGGRG
jgi:hypothetical protein